MLQHALINAFERSFELSAIESAKYAVHRTAAIQIPNTLSLALYLSLVR